MNSFEKQQDTPVSPVSSFNFDEDETSHEHVAANQPWLQRTNTGLSNLEKSDGRPGSAEMSAYQANQQLSMQCSSSHSKEQAFNPAAPYIARQDTDTGYSMGSETTLQNPNQSEDASSLKGKSRTFPTEGPSVGPNQGHSHGGQRIETVLRRGIQLTKAQASTHSKIQNAWLPAIQTITQHIFRDPDLLEEALEPPNSGITCVGTSHRHLENGNVGLSNIGHRVMKMHLWTLCYLYKIPDSEAKGYVRSILDKWNLERVGKASGINQFVRPVRPLRKRDKRNPLKVFVDDVRREDPVWTISRGVKAVVGAVFLDGGLEVAVRVMGELGLVIGGPK
ncbi:hypothetical protein B0J14DRAFT_703484 [Halenospora varia]|nr:hypothetical protein B0J14DRAFT_703484 [Halenospora varia]